MRNAYGFVLVFDCTSHRSLEELQQYTERISRIKMDEFKTVNGKDYPIILIGNKCDLPLEDKSYKQLTEKEVKDFAKNQLGLSDKTPVFFASAKNDINMKEALESIIREMREFEKGQTVTKPSLHTPKEHKGLFASASSHDEKDNDLDKMMKL